MASVAPAPVAPAPIAAVGEIRRQFPALDRQYGGHPIAYFDAPGGTQVPRSVADAVSDYLLHHNANTHWPYPTSQETDAAIAAARQAMADLLGAAAEEIAFGANMTTLTFHLARALASTWGPGDEIIVTELDHHANVAPWRRVARERGLTVKTVPIDTAAGELDWPAFERALTSHTRLVAVGAASNALGTITDVRRVRERAREAGAFTFVDAVHFAPHELLDVRAIGCDFLACSAYKFYGPHVGVLYGRRDRLRTLDVPKLEPAPDAAPERLETGTQNHEGIVGAAAAVDFLASLAAGGSRRDRLVRAYAGLHARGEQLLRQMWEGLAAIRGVRLYGPPPGRPRTPTVAFTLTAVPSRQVAERLAERGVFVSCGDFYATTVAERLGHARDGMVRAGCGVYTTESEVARLVEGVAEIAV